MWIFFIGIPPNQRNIYVSVLYCMPISLCPIGKLSNIRGHSAPPHC